MTMVKDDVINWFRGQCGALRIETICALLDCCLPYELRYVGTILENLGKRDFHELREAEKRANAFATHKTSEENKKALFNLLSDTGGLTGVHPNSNPGPGPHISNHHNQTVPTNSHDTSTSRPSPIHGGEQKIWPHWNSDAHQHPPQISSSTSLNLSQKSKSLVNSSIPGTSTIHMNGTSPVTNCVNNCNTCIVDESDKNDMVPGTLDLDALSDERKRHRLTLYFSLLRVSNRVCSSAFYSLLTHVDQTVNNDIWLEGRDENTLEELALLYTMGNNHPAFTFEQRTIVGGTLNRIRAQLQRYKIPKTYPPPQAYLSGFDPKYCHYYVQYVPHNAAHIQHQVQVPQPPVGGVVGNLSSGPSAISPVDISRMTQPLSYGFPQYSQYPLFMQPHSQPHTSIQNQIVGKTLGTTLNSKPPNLQQSVSLDSGWMPKKVGKEKSLSSELDHQPSQMNDPTMPIVRSRKIHYSCYNCGAQNHSGHECKESTIEEMTKHLYRLNFSSSSAESS